MQYYTILLITVHSSLSHNINAQLLQMVHLIQDPKGETVMGPSTNIDTAIHVQTKPSSTTGPPSQQKEVANGFWNRKGKWYIEINIQQLNIMTL